MADDAYTMPRRVSRTFPSIPVAALIYRPGYFRRALAYLHCGALPPLPLRSDLVGLAVPTVAMVLGLLIGGAR
ncbi:hypothetical protein [Roseomonas sp. USHLN139]|uniref:hypothetical protein n=1 Tax=Roseomonas sp. USHLN139 TaxID=3081298 RepID=UPI003B015072